MNTDRRFAVRAARAAERRCREAAQRGWRRPDPGPCRRVSALAFFSLLALVALVASLYYMQRVRPSRRRLAADASMLEAPEFDRCSAGSRKSCRSAFSSNQQPIEAEEVESTDPKVRIYQLL